jgi:CitB family two-component system sensor histidine kinase CitS
MTKGKKINMTNKIPLKTKILGLICSLLLLVIMLLAGIFSFMLSIDTKQHMEQMALQAAKTISFMPEIRKAVESEITIAEIEPIAEQVREQVEAAEITLESSDAILYSSSNAEWSRRTAEDRSNDRALIFGGSYTFEGQGVLGQSLIGKAPIIADYGKYNKVVGVVTVEYLKNDIYSSIFSRIKPIILFSFGVLMLGVIGGILLTKSIRKDTLGLEPHEIATLYRERSAILLSIREGIIAVDETGRLTLINPSARSMLGLEGVEAYARLQDIIPQIDISEVLRTGHAENNLELVINELTFIVNLTPIHENKKVAGVVASLRDKTELNQLMDTISEVREYSEGLRAQTHDFTNKLYLLSGLHQLGQYEEAYDFIQKESKVHHIQNRILFEQIHDYNVQAILLGKLGKASEKKVNLEIDSESTLHELPDHIGVSQMIIIIGNLIDNAMDAVMDQQKKHVLFSMTDSGNNIVIEVIDSGKGIVDEKAGVIFQKGFSTKGNNRGYGLANVSKVVELLNGTIEVSNKKNGGTIFTIFLPKNK